MKKENYYKEKIIEKLERSNYFGKDVLISIRKDLDLFSEEEFKEKQKRISKNSKTIIASIPKREIDNYFKMAF